MVTRHPICPVWDDFSTSLPTGDFHPVYRLTAKTTMARIHRKLPVATIKQQRGKRRRVD
jgi:hypothetical protein